MPLAIYTAMETDLDARARAERDPGAVAIALLAGGKLATSRAWSAR